MAADDVTGNIIEQKHYQTILTDLENIGKNESLDATQRKGIEQLLDRARRNPVRSHADIEYLAQGTAALNLPPQVNFEKTLLYTLAFEASNIELGATAKNEATLAQHRQFYIETVVDRVIEEINSAEVPAKEKNAAVKNVERLRPNGPVSQSRAQEIYDTAHALYRRGKKSKAYESMGNEVDFLKMVAEHEDPSKILPYQAGAAAESMGKINKFLDYFEDPTRVIDPKQVPKELQDDFGPLFTILLARQEREQKIQLGLKNARKLAAGRLKELKTLKDGGVQESIDKAKVADDLVKYVTDASAALLTDDGKPKDEDTLANERNIPPFRYKDDKKRHPAHPQRKALYTILTAYAKLLESYQQKLEAKQLEIDGLGGIKQEVLDEEREKNKKLEERIADLEAQLENEAAWRSSEAERADSAEEKTDEANGELIAYKSEYTVKKSDYDGQVAAKERFKSLAAQADAEKDELTQRVNKALKP